MATKIDIDNAFAYKANTLAAHYLLNAKRLGETLLDPVASFHLGNGVRIHAIYSDVDTSENGMAQSHGVMVNYMYD